MEVALHPSPPLPRPGSGVEVGVLGEGGPHPQMWPGCQAFFLCKQGGHSTCAGRRRGGEVRALGAGPAPGGPSM